MVRRDGQRFDSVLKCVLAGHVTMKIMNRRFVSLVLSIALLAGVLSAAQVPRHSPEFAINMADGRQVLLSQYRGKVVALAFILTTCPHCQQTIQVLSKLQNEYGPRGFQVLASATDEMPKLYVPDFIRKFQPPFPVGYSNRDSAIEYLQHPPTFRMMMPQIVFVDRQGTIRGQYAGDDPFFSGDQEKAIAQTIDKLLKESAPVSSRKASRRGQH